MGLYILFYIFHWILFATRLEKQMSGINLPMDKKQIIALNGQPLLCTHVFFVI